MSKPRRKSGKIDNEIKVYALDQFHAGKRLCEISKEIGYLEQTIKYWVDNAETILSNQNGNFGIKIPHAIKMEVIKLHDEQHADVYDIAKCCDISQSLVRYFIKNREKILAKPEETSFNADEPLAKRPALNSNNMNNTAANSNSFLQQPTLVKLMPKPQTVQNISQPPETPPTSDSPQEIQDDQFTDLIRDFHNCEQVVLELQEFIGIGRRMVNRAANSIQQFQETLKQFEIRKKTKRELS